MEFTNASVPETPPPKKNNLVSTKDAAYINLHGRKVLVDESVVFTYDASENSNCLEIRTLADVMRMQETNPNALLAIKPKLYSTFMKRGKINPFVKVGDKVRYKKFASQEDNSIKVVSSIRIESLGDMSVIIASFEDGGYSLTYLLEIVNEN